MKYYCFYINCGARIAEATIIMTENCDKINAVQRVLHELGYSSEEIDNLNEFVESAKDKTSKIQLLNLD